MKLRMLLKSAYLDAGLVEITPFGGRPAPRPGDTLRRDTDAATGLVRDINERTGEVVHEYLRGVLGIDLTFTASGPQVSSFDDVEAWAAEHLRRGGLLELTIAPAEV